MKILIVDDDDASIEIVKASLEADGHEVLTASEGSEAVAILDKDPVRLVITDWMMPGMNGLDLCRRIRATPRPYYTFIIMLTGRAGTQDVIDGLEAGADEFVTKPVNPAELRIRVRTGKRMLSLESRHLAIFAMAKLAESRDPETGLHLERIREYTRLLCRQLNMDGNGLSRMGADFAETLYLTSPLHDIGKVGIPDSILLKPGRLNDEEFNVMKTHTTIAGDTLSAAARHYPGVRFLNMARDIAMTHHERFDGRGYPFGLAGDNIPLAGRIVCLADVYDALTSKRVYKTAYTHGIARSMIEAERNRHFDPALVDAFLAVDADFGRVRAQFSESGDTSREERAVAEPAPDVPGSFLRG